MTIDRRKFLARALSTGALTTVGTAGAAAATGGKARPRSLDLAGRARRVRAVARLHPHGVDAAGVAPAPGARRDRTSPPRPGRQPCHLRAVQLPEAGGRRARRR